MINEIEIIDNLMDKLSSKHTLLGKEGHSWSGIKRTDIRASMIKLNEAKELLNWIK